MGVERADVNRQIAFHLRVIQHLEQSVQHLIYVSFIRSVIFWHVFR